VDTLVLVDSHEEVAERLVYVMIVLILRQVNFLFSDRAHQALGIAILRLLHEGAAGPGPPREGYGCSCCSCVRKLGLLPPAAGAVRCAGAARAAARLHGGRPAHPVPS